MTSPTSSAASYTSISPCRQRSPGSSSCIRSSSTWTIRRASRAASITAARAASPQGRTPAPGDRREAGHSSWPPHHAVRSAARLARPGSCSPADSGGIDGDRWGALARSFPASWRELLKVCFVAAHLESIPPDLDLNGELIADPERVLHDRYGADKECLYLVRPDGYVGYRAQPATASAFHEYMVSVLGSAAMRSN